MSDIQEAAGILVTTRDHVAYLTEKAQKLQAECDQIRGDVESRYQLLEHDLEQLQTHIQSEHTRADSAFQAVLGEAHSSQAWLTATLASIDQELGSLDHDVAGLSTTIAHDTESLTQNAHQVGVVIESSATQMQAHIESADSTWRSPHGQASDAVRSRLSDGKAHIEILSNQIHASVLQQVDTVLGQEEAQFAAGLHRLSDTASSALSKRGDDLHAGIVHAVDGVKHEHETQHQILASDLHELGHGLQALQSMLTQDAAGLVHSSHDAVTLMQASNIGVEEVLKIINDVIEIFHEIIDEKP